MIAVASPVTRMLSITACEEVFNERIKPALAGRVALLATYSRVPVPLAASCWGIVLARVDAESLNWPVATLSRLTNDVLVKLTQAMPLDETVAPYGAPSAAIVENAKLGFRGGGRGPIGSRSVQASVTARSDRKARRREKRIGPQSSLRGLVLGQSSLRGLVLGPTEY